MYRNKFDDVSDDPSHRVSDYTYEEFIQEFQAEVATEDLLEEDARVEAEHEDPQSSALPKRRGRRAASARADPRASGFKGSGQTSHPSLLVLIRNPRWERISLVAPPLLMMPSPK